MRRLERVIHAGRLASDVRRGVVWPHPKTINVWDRATEERHGATPADAKKIADVLGIKEHHKVLVPFSFSGEWYKAVRSVAPNTVALDFSRNQLMRYNGARVQALGQALPFRDRAFDHVVAFEPTPFVGAFSPLSATPTLLELLRVGKKVHIITPSDNRPWMRALAKFARVKMREKNIDELIIHNRKLPVPESAYTYRGRPRKLFRKVAEDVGCLGRRYLTGELRGRLLEKEILRFVQTRPASKLIKIYLRESERYRWRL